MIESANAYINEIPANWKESVKQGFGFGVIIGVLSSPHKLFSVATINSGFFKGAVFATANLVSSLMVPALKKIGNKDIQETIDIFTRNFIVVSITLKNFNAGLTAASVLAAINAFSALFCTEDTLVDKKDCTSAANVLNFAILYRNDFISGIKNGAILVAARVVIKKAFPFFQSKIAEYEIFERTGLNTFVKKLPSGWGLGCSKIAAGIFLNFKSKGPKELFFATMFPAGFTFSYLTNKSALTDNSFPKEFRDNITSLNNLLGSFILQS